MISQLLQNTSKKVGRAPIHKIEEGGGFIALGEE